MILGDDEVLRGLQNELLQQPERGDVLRGGAGLRKMRLGLKGKGKSGGARVIYLYLKDIDTIVLVTLYSKSDQTNLSPKDTAILAALVANTKKELQR